MKLYVVKKDGTREIFNVEKIINAVNKSAARILYKFSEDEIRFICNFAQERAESLGKENIDIQDMHNIVEGALDHVNPAVAKSYRDYRNYKKDFVHMMDDVYTKSQSIRYIGDKSNANTDSALVATKRSLIFNELNKELYRKFFMNRNELQACRDGYIYIHDQSARLDTMNCCLFDIASVLNGGFEMGNVWYNEPKTLDTAFDVMGDIILSTAAQQYGGFTVPEVDKVLAAFQEELPESVSIQRIADQPKVVDDSVSSFVRDLFVSIVVVILVMMLLFPFKSAIVAATSIPISIFISIGIMYAVGIPLNTVTLAALIVVLGMIVDNSIVVMEACMRYRSEGLTPKEAAVQGTPP